MKPLPIIIGAGLMLLALQAEPIQAALGSLMSSGKCPGCGG